MRHYVTFDAIGTIVQVGYYDDETFAAMGALRGDMLEIPDPAPQTAADVIARYYVSGGVLLARLQIMAVIDKVSFAASGSDFVTITGLPVPCVARTTGTVVAGPFDVTDGVLEITSDQTGDITVTVTAEPGWLPWSVAIHAI